MTTFTFAPATRETAKARIALQGPGGSGKTKTALRMAEGLAAGGAIGVVDTERGSALKYAPVPGRPDIEAHEFAHLPMAFCSPENLIAAVKAAEQARLAVLIVDSWSHFWAGKGGLLARVEEEGRKISGGKFSAWDPVNKLEQDMLDALLGFPGHVIVTMRTKNDYELTGGKVKKLGVKTVQREGAEYEVDVVIDMVAGTGTVTKTRYTALEDACVHHPGPDFAEAILEQLGQGVDPVQAIVDELVREGLTYDRALEIHGQAQSRNLLGADLLHPKTGEPGKLGDLIREYGQAVKPVTNAPSAPSAPPAGQSAGTPAAAPSDAEQGQGYEPVTAPQMRMMHACFTKVGLGHKDLREQRLRSTSLIVGRPLSSANELTKGEAQTLLDTLTQWGDRENPADEFAAMVQGLEDHAIREAGDALYVGAAQSA
ncbi:AAA family ATPase [Streptomyces sp. DSM 3412]|uniref:AAA family ATPase n=1 Tax=Streptomyces gottesmaniae TaxID=3075518 RepID=A0ABU2YUV9_9ACTN|nr:AAA family ATPase [Streptomyces sp. DSM 3412]MDT0567870.1 AAA family ATPase [Streptomyces sp. DSM 3412]